MLASIYKSSRLARNLGRRLASGAAVLAAAAGLALPALAQTTNAVFVSLGGTGEAGYVNGAQGFSEFSTPSAVAAPGDGFLYIADFGNNVIRKLNLVDRVVTTFASNNVVRPVGVVFDSQKNMFVANQGTGRITKYSSSGAYLTSINSPTAGGSITALAIDEVDYLYVAHINGRVERISPSGFPSDTYQGNAGSEFRGVAVGSDGTVYASDAARHVVWKFNSLTDPVVFAGTLGSPGEAVGGFTSGQFDRPHHIAFAPNGSLVVADRGNHQLRAVDCDGVISVLVGIDPDLWFTFESPDVFPGWWDSSPEFAELREPIGVTVDLAGNVFDTEAFYHLVRGGRNLKFPSCGEDPGPGGPVTIVLSPNTGVFTNQVLTVTPADGTTFGTGTRLYYTLDGSDPTTISQQIPIVNGIGTITLAGRVDFGNVKVRTWFNGVLGPVVSGVPTTFEPVSVRLNPNQGYFPDGVDVEVTSVAPGGFGPQVQIFYTLDGSTPTTNSPSATIENGSAVIRIIGPVDISSLSVRAFNNGVAGPIVQGLPTVLPLPGLNPPSGYFITNVVVTVTNANNSAGLFPQGTRIFYTRDGSEPTQSSPEATIVGGIAQITLTGPINLENLKVRAFLGNSGSATVSGEPTSNIPNRISFGFEPPEEASSDFVAAPGQRFIAPVTLTIRPGQLMYGLQFGLNITNLTGPASANYLQGFDSMLVQPVQPAGFAVIPPATLATRTVSIEPEVVEGNVIWVTNVVLDFSSLLVTNSNNNLLMVGWLERYQATNLYNTLQHDLIRYSLPHDRLFISQEGNKVVTGGYSFVLPATAQAGETYEIEISRPSANADGIREDVFIETPNDPTIPIRAVQTVTVGERRYTVGDLAPFRWFNAGDFGDGSILNNDMEQIHQTVIYGVNAPPPGSDFEGSIDSCCVDTNGVNLAATYQPWDGNDTVINTIGFGDGELDIADLYVSFRRALDPSLVWYERYWSNGVLRANPIANTFRGQISGFSASSFKNTAAPEDAKLGASSVSEPSSVHFSVAPVKGNPGEVVEVPIYAQVKGPHPIRTLLLNLSVKTIDGRAPITENVTFWAHPLLGGPTFGGGGTTAGFAGAWIDPNHSGLSGDVLVGTLVVPIPENATASSAYLVSFEKVSVSPNGIGKLPVTTQDAAIIMANRPNVGWNDGIPDTWRVEYFGTLATLQAAADADADGDGVTNRGEFDLGSNPTNPGDHLRVRGSILPDRTMKFRFPTAAGLVYRLEVNTNLNGGEWTVVQENILGTGSEIELSSTSEAPLGYYRIQVQQ